MEFSHPSQTQVVASSWGVFDRLTDTAFQAAKKVGIDAIQAQLLHNRGVSTPQAMRAFLDARYDQTPDPLLLIDMPRACERIRRALSTQEHITIYGDYDADGVTSAAILTRALHTLNHPAALLDYHIPHRLLDSRGLSESAIDLLKARGTSLIITTDSGSSDVEPVAYAKTLGIDVIITDHHHPPERLPHAYAMINPWRPDCTYGERYLCGAGIAFKLTQALYRSYGLSRAEEQVLLDLVAIGTIADVAPLLGENHTLVRLGLERLRKTQNCGMLALMQRAKLQPERLRERDIGYVLGPRLNAAGRMEHARIAFELLTTDDATHAAQCADHLEYLNQERQKQTETLMSSARAEAQLRPHDSVVLISGDNWHEGIIGLVAGKLTEEIHRPVLVLSRGPEVSKGSARSQTGFNLVQALQGFSQFLVRYGGHAQAAGFTIENKYVETLREHLLQCQRRETSGTAEAGANAGTEHTNSTDLVLEQESGPTLYTPKVDLLFTRPEMVAYSTYSKIEELSPFGASNSHPTFRMDGIRLVDYWSTGPDGRNLRMTLEVGGVQFTGMFLRGAARQLSLIRGSRATLIFHIEPAWTSAEGESKQKITLKIVDVVL